jgi:hypothetical protein
LHLQIIFKSKTANPYKKTTAATRDLTLTFLLTHHLSKKNNGTAAAAAEKQSFIKLLISLK